MSSSLIKQMIVQLIQGTPESKDAATKLCKQVIQNKSASILGERYAEVENEYEPSHYILITISGQNAVATPCDQEGIPDGEQSSNDEYNKVAMRVSRTLAMHNPKGHQAITNAVQRVAQAVLGSNVKVFVNYDTPSF